MRNFMILITIVFVAASCDLAPNKAWDAAADTDMDSDTDTDTDADTDTDSDTDSDTDTDSTDCTGVLYFPDDALEAAIRLSIDKPTGDIFDVDIAEDTHLNAEGTGVMDFIGLQCYGDHLWYANFPDNSVGDLTPLTDVNGIVHLKMPNNEVADISVVSDMTELITLDLSGNNVSDVSPLARPDPLGTITNLEFLYLSDNNISDIADLHDLFDLSLLELAGNNISDVSALECLERITTLDLADNNITDISALVENVGDNCDTGYSYGGLGIDVGDDVDLSGNPLDCSGQSANVTALRNRGAAVHWDCDSL